MSSLAQELMAHSGEITHCWYERWRSSEHPHADIDEAGLKDLLSAHLRLIGEQLRDVASAERPTEMWRPLPERLDPEKRVHQDFPIEEVVQEYGLAVQVVRDWIDERGIEVPFIEYSYFYQAIYELTAEAVRRYAQHQAEIVTKLRGEYLAGIMHQLRTPLASLGTDVQRLERGGQPDAKMLDRLHRSVHRLQVLVQGVLRLERFAPHELPVHPVRVQLGALLDAVASDYHERAVRKGLRLEVGPFPSMESRVDPNLLTDALGNLVHNAITYTREGFVRVEVEETTSEVVFRVRDSGPGIPEQKRRELFRPVRPGEAGGAGIGLQIARHAVEAQGGTIGVDSRPGEGSVFWIRLPREVPERSDDGADRGGRAGA